MKLSSKQILVALAAVCSVGGTFTSALGDESDGSAKMVMKTVRDPVTQETVKECTIRTPDQASVADIAYGLSKEQLMHMSQLSATDQAWVQWYLGGADKYNQIINPAQGSKDSSIRRATNWARCESMSKFIKIANRDMFKSPIEAPLATMVCKGTPYTYSFQTVGNHVHMDITWATTAQVAPARPVPGAMALTIPAATRTISHEKVVLTHTGDSSCPLRVTQTLPNDKKIRMCLPLTPQNEIGEGSVSMHIAGRDLPADQQQIACQPDENFMKIATRVPAKIPRSAMVSEVSSGASISR